MASFFKNVSDLLYLVNGRSRSRKRGRPSQGADLIGSQDQLRPVGHNTYRTRVWDIVELPIRGLLYGDVALAIECEEMITWSPEMTTCLRLISQNCFQSSDGSVESWRVKTKRNDGLPLERSPNDRVIGIARDLSNRYSGRDPVLGAQRLEQAVYGAYGRGDAFMELSIQNDGAGRWYIERSNYLPAWSMFVEEDETGKLISYRQQVRTQPSESDRIWGGYDTARILQFSYGMRQRYGFPACFAQIESWRKMKDASILLERSAGESLAFWIHTCGEQHDNTYLQNYRSEFEANLASGQGYISHVYLPHGSDIRRSSEANPSLKGLMDYYMQTRYSCMLPTVPVPLIAGLGIVQGASKELGNLPAISYGRTIAHARSIIAEQIIYAIGLEYTLNYGYEEWCEERPFVEIAWPSWVNFDGIPGLNPVSQPSKPIEVQEEEAKEKFVQLNGDFLRTRLG